jgi:hypothetical protein
VLLRLNDWPSVAILDQEPVVVEVEVDVDVVVSGTWHDFTTP